MRSSTVRRGSTYGAGLLQFLNAWLTTDQDQLNASLHRFVGHPGLQIKLNIKRPQLPRMAPFGPPDRADDWW